MTTYTVAVGAENAEMFASPAHDLAANGIALHDLGDGRIRFGSGALEWLREYPDDQDGCISEGDGELLMWIDGVPHPVKPE